MRLLDLYCCAGGCSVGYIRAGFDDVVGVDILPQPKYPYEFHQADAISYLLDHYGEFDAIHASPPCQHYSQSTRTWKSVGREYPDLISATRETLVECGKPWIMENVPGAPLERPVLLCGQMFGLPLYRHRLFETSFSLEQPHHPKHVAPQVKMGRKPKLGEYVQAVGHFSGVPDVQAAMEIAWMGQKELAQAIPPAYTQYVGEALLRLL
jgi:DNA (cytosine-5)-methyltransferase 1